MTSIDCVIARTQQQIDDALRVRYQVFGQEMGLLEPTPRFIRREIDVFDTLASTVHFVAYAGAVPVAAARLLLPNAEVARENGSVVGIDLDFKFDLGPVAVPGVVLAETTRLCVLRAFRGSPALVRVYAEMHRESLRRGVTHWVASANTETDSMEDALIAHRVAGSMGLTSDRLCVLPRESVPAPTSPRVPLYAPEDRTRAQRGDLRGLALPRTLALFAGRMGARYIGAPIYDPRFRMCSMPLMLDLNEEQWLRSCAAGEREQLQRLSA